MKKPKPTTLKLMGAAAILSSALFAPAMAQEATQEPGIIGFNYPNADYLTGGYGVRTPTRWPRFYGPAYYAGPPVYYRGPLVRFYPGRVYRVW